MESVGTVPESGGEEGGGGGLPGDPTEEEGEGEDQHCNAGWWPRAELSFDGAPERVCLGLLSCAMGGIAGRCAYRQGVLWGVGLTARVGETEAGRDQSLSRGTGGCEPRTHRAGPAGVGHPADLPGTRQA